MQCRDFRLQAHRFLAMWQRFFRLAAVQEQLAKVGACRRIAGDRAPLPGENA